MLDEEMGLAGSKIGGSLDGDRADPDELRMILGVDPGTWLYAVQETSEGEWRLETGAPGDLDMYRFHAKGATAETLETPSVEHDGGPVIEGETVVGDGTGEALPPLEEQAAPDVIGALNKSRAEMAPHVPEEAVTKLVAALSPFCVDETDDELAHLMANTVIVTLAPFFQIPEIQKEREPYDYDAANLGTDVYEPTALRSAIRDSMVTRFRHQPKTWQQMSEDEQMDCANAFDQAAGEVIRAMVSTMLDFDAPQVSIKLGKASYEGGDKAKIEGKFTADYDEETLVKIFRQQHKVATLVMMESADFNMNGFSFRPMPNQPALPLDPPKQSKADIEADVAAMGTQDAAPEPAPEPAPAEKTAPETVEVQEEASTPAETPPELGPTARQRSGYVTRAANMAKAGETIRDAQYLAARMGIPLAEAQIAFDKLVEKGLITAGAKVSESSEPAPAENAIEDEAASFTAAAGDAFEATEEELQAQSPRQTLKLNF